MGINIRNVFVTDDIGGTYWIASADSGTVTVTPGYIEEPHNLAAQSGMDTQVLLTWDPPYGPIPPEFSEDFGMITRVGRFHNVYGPNGTYDGGREKAPAAMCRKVIEAEHTGKKDIVIWGDGEQTRSFMYIDDGVKGIIDIMYSDIEEPINLGSSEMVSINQLVDIVEEIAGIKLQREYDLEAPKGVRGRNSDNTLIKEYLDWEPSIPLKDGMQKTYDWIKEQMTKA